MKESKGVREGSPRAQVRVHRRRGTDYRTFRPGRQRLRKLATGRTTAAAAHGPGVTPLRRHDDLPYSGEAALPAAGARAATARRLGRRIFPGERVLSRGQLAAMAFLSVVWVAVNVQFWGWWIPRATAGTPWLAGAVTAALAYQAAFLPTMFFAYVSRMRRPAHRPAPVGVRVAVITPCVPACESHEVIERQLRAIAEIEYPHDSWVLDESGDPEVRRMAEELGVRYFTRCGVEKWNEPGPPFQRATKAGNVNAWLAHVEDLGHDYDVFVQMDIDHRPRRCYLHQVLGHFDAPDVAWVQAPSLYGNMRHWTARGLAEQDLVFHGPLQMGFYGATGTPFIIGSHTSYRTSAIREIGGFQPTRAEDHLDTVVLASRGHRGVFVPELLAVGDGPDDFATYLRQQFAWAHSMITVFFTWTPRLLPRYRPFQAVQFLFSQSWYLLWSVSLLVLWAAPAAATLTDERIARGVTLSEYLLYAVPVALVGWTMWCFARPHFQPRGLGLSWRAAVLTVARWPVVLWALVSVLLRIERPYMITPKPGSGDVERPRARATVVYGPLIALGTIPIAAMWAAHAWTAGGGGEHPYALLSLVNAAVPIVALAVAALLEVRDGPPGRSLRARVRGREGTLACGAALVAAWAATTVVLWNDVAGAVG